MSAEKEKVIPRPPRPQTNLEWAQKNDVTVARMLREGEALSTIVTALAQEKKLYVKRILELESIAPRKIVMPDGAVMLWQCPAELVPPWPPGRDVSQPTEP